MSDEENSNEGSNNEEEEENEGEENEDDEEKEEDEDNEGEENEDDEEKEEDEDNEDEEKEEEEEDEEDDKKKKKKKKGKGKGKEKEDKKKGKEKKDKKEENKDKKEEGFNPGKEIKVETTNTSNPIMFNGNDITVGNIIPKKSTLQLLMEISTDMESLSSHIEKTMPIKPLPPIKLDYNNNNNYDINKNSFINNANISFANLDKDDLEIKQLIEKANHLSNISRLNNQIKPPEIKTYEDKCCQSDEDIDNNDYNNLSEERDISENYLNNYNNINQRKNEFPYDPYKHLNYYNNLKNSNNDRMNQNKNNHNINDNNRNDIFNTVRMKKMDELYHLKSNLNKQPIIYTQPQSKSNTMRNMMINKSYKENFDINDTNNRNGKDNYSERNENNENYENNNNYFEDNNNNNNLDEDTNKNNNKYENNNFIQYTKNDTNKINMDNNNMINRNNLDNNENKYERFRPRSINQAMNILLDKE